MFQPLKRAQDWCCRRNRGVRLTFNVASMKRSAIEGPLRCDGRSRITLRFIQATGRAPLLGQFVWMPRFVIEGNRSRDEAQRNRGPLRCDGPSRITLRFIRATGYAPLLGQFVWMPQFVTDDNRSLDEA